MFIAEKLRFLYSESYLKKNVTKKNSGKNCATVHQGRI